MIDDGSEHTDLAAQGAATIGTTGVRSIGLDDVVTGSCFASLDRGAGEPSDLEEHRGPCDDQGCEPASEPLGDERGREPANNFCEVTLPP